MGKSLRSKMFTLFTLILILFMSISSFMSFEISKRVIIQNMLLSGEAQAKIIMNQMHGINEDLLGELHLLASNIKVDTNFERIKSNSYEEIKNSAERIHSFFRSILYSSDYFKSVFHISDGVIIGTSLVESTYRREDMPQNLIRSEDIAEIKFEISQYLKPTIKDIEPQQIIVAPIMKDGRQDYLVGILDYAKIMEDKNRDIAILNDRGEIIFSTIHNPYVLDRAKYIYQDMGDISYANTVFDEYIISAIKSTYGTIYMYVGDMSSIYGELNIIKRRLVISNVILFIVFIGIALIYSHHINRPIGDFTRIINNINDFDSIFALKNYIKSYVGNRSIRRSTFHFFSLIFIPVVITILISFFSFRKIILNDRYRSYMDVVEQTGANIEDKLKRHSHYMKYLMLDEHIQQILFNTVEKGNHRFRKLQWKSYMSNILLNKGILEKRVAWISILDPDFSIIYRSNDNASNNISYNIRDQINKRGIITEVKKQTNGTKSISLLSDIKYLPPAHDKTHAFRKLGYIELGVGNILDEEIKLVYPQTSVSSYLIDQDLEVIAQFEEGKYNLNLFKESISEENFQSPSYNIIVADRNHLLVGTYPIEGTSWLLISMVYLEPLGRDDLTVLTYNSALLIILFIFIILLSQVLSNNILSNTTKISEDIKAIGDGTDLVARIDENKYEYEFVTLAKSFNEMLGRLKRLSVELREREIENADLDKRRHRALLTALQAQINPHFLYNIITSIILLIKGNRVDSAIEMLVATGRLFKFSLYGTQESVSMYEEIEHVHNYMEIQRIRYDNQVEYSIDVDKKFHEIKVPKFILQPLVENSIEHGIYNSQVLNIGINCFKLQGADGRVEIIIKDDGRGVSKHKLAEIIQSLSSPDDVEHHGLVNVHERIRLQFGDEYGIEIKSEEGQGTTVIIKLPNAEGGR